MLEPRNEDTLSIVKLENSFARSVKKECDDDILLAKRRKADLLNSGAEDKSNITLLARIIPRDHGIISIISRGCGQ